MENKIKRLASLDAKVRAAKAKWEALDDKWLTEKDEKKRRKLKLERDIQYHQMCVYGNQYLLVQEFGK